MKILRNFPHQITEIDNIWIPLADGTRLAARIWLPADAAVRPVPALLEYIPYRKNDWTAIRDALRHPYFAGHGYASIHVDMRGSGDSDGLLLDEYLLQEQEDALEVLAWIAAQPWCDGQVGMFGKSWGGFNALQIAARRPPQLKAIITIYSTDDRYADDVHYMGGAVLGYEMLPWASVMLALNAAPPDPRTVGDRWREMWLKRLQETPAYVETWLAHQTRDSYWKHGSVAEDFAAIEVPVFAVGGWADGYTNPVFRLLEGLSSPTLGLIGPWAHVYPEEGTPAPAVGFLQESLRWWDHWLKGKETGIMSEPKLRVFMQDSVPPQTSYTARPGCWIGETIWPLERQNHQVWQLSDHGQLNEKGSLSRPQTITGRLTAGMDTPAWCAFGHPGDYAPDQQMIDGQSVIFTAEPQNEKMEILGFPVVRCTVAADRPVAHLIIRLCDVAPHGQSTLISYGVLNLTHRHSHERPEPVEPGVPMTVTVKLNAIGHVLPATHRWRVAIMPHYWPMIWPAPEPVTLTVINGSLSLPLRDLTTPDQAGTPFLPAEVSPPLALNILRPVEVKRETHEDMLTGRKTMSVIFDNGRVQFPDHHLMMEDVAHHHYSITADDPLSAEVICEHQLIFERGEWRIQIDTVSKMTATATHFVVENVIDAFEGDTCAVHKTFYKEIPRNFQ